METSRWNKIEEIFSAALDLSEPERPELLDQLCGGDAGLLQEVTSLLSIDSKQGSGIGQTVDRTAIAFCNDDCLRGRQLGGYLIDSELGRGGMGVVYLAHRPDGEFRKQVAIKVIERVLDTGAVLERFHRERLILGRLDHPYIARLLDGGTSSDGRPYLVMEYVDGLPIDIFCSVTRLSIAGKCELIRHVCEAVSFAHRNLVIHGDLKSTNIVITPDGIPKLLGCGISRLLTEPGQDTLQRSTQDAPALSTASCDSPEQLQRTSITTAADVFSIGKILESVLNGAGASKDLLSIVAMATREEPDRRYSSIDQISEDLRRYLTGMPVAARVPTRRYRALKFVQRHRFTVAVAISFALIFAAGVTIAMWHARQAERRLSQTVQIANLARFDTDDAISALSGSVAARRTFVLHTLEDLHRLSKDADNDRRMLFQLGTAYSRVAAIQGDSTRPDLADLRGAQENCNKAKRILESLEESDPANTDIRIALSELYHLQGHVLGASGQTKLAVTNYELGISKLSGLPERQAGALAARISSSHGFTIVYNDPSRALALARQDLPFNERQARVSPRRLPALMNLAGNYCLLGQSFAILNRLQDGLEYYRKCVAVRENAMRISPNDTRVQRDLMIAYGHLADLLGSPFQENLGDSIGAIDNYKKAARIAAAITAADPQDQSSKSDLAHAWLRIGCALSGSAQVAESQDFLAKAEHLFLSLSEAQPNPVLDRVSLALLHQYRGRRFQQAGKIQAAVAEYRRSVEVYEGAKSEYPHQDMNRVQALNDYSGVALLHRNLGAKPKLLPWPQPADLRPSMMSENRRHR